VSDDLPTRDCFYDALHGGQRLLLIVLNLALRLLPAAVTDDDDDGKSATMSPYSIAVAPD
jgi:hypothetical protein